MKPINQDILNQHFIWFFPLDLSSIRVNFIVPCILSIRELIEDSDEGRVIGEADSASDDDLVVLCCMVKAGARCNFGNFVIQHIDTLQGIKKPSQRVI